MIGQKILLIHDVSALSMSIAFQGHFLQETKETTAHLSNFRTSTETTGTFPKQDKEA